MSTLRLTFGISSVIVSLGQPQISTASEAQKKAMFEHPDEPVRVYVDFDGHKVRPIAFLLRGRRYNVKRVNLVSESGTGPTRRYLFAVSDAANSFTLEYNPFDLSWRLKEVYAEG